MANAFKFLFIHCTATPSGRWVSAETVKQWHTAKAPQGNGWSKVGYSDLILLDGTRHRFVRHDNDRQIDDFEVTNGVRNWNSTSRHLCYVGGLSADLKKALDTRTQSQMDTMEAIIKEVLAYAPDVKILGHNQADNKACPSFFVPFWLRSIGILEKNIYTADPNRVARTFPDTCKLKLAA